MTDRREKNESSDRQREELLARRLAEALDQRGGGTGAKDCPDADVIAAYAEQALAPGEAAQCENHFATCARCRTILRVLTASVDTPLAEKEVTHLGELFAATRAPAHVSATGSPGARRRLFDWRMRWLAPAMGVAAAVAVLLVLRPFWHAPQPANSEVLVAQAPKQEQPLPPSASPLVEGRVVKESAPQEKKTDSAAAAKQQVETRDREERAYSQAPRPNLQTAPAAGTEEISGNKRASADEQAKVAPLALQPSAPPAAASGINAGTERQLETGAPPASTPQSVTVTEAAPMVQKENSAVGAAAQPRAATDLPLNGRNFQSLARLKAGGGGPILLKAPSGQTLWRVGGGGSIQRSIDAGQTWTPQASPSNADWLSGAAVSGTVCWIAGRQGAIARTRDGEHWEMVPPPTQSADAAGNLSAWLVVEARDAQSATITAGDGRSFATQDGGKTWQAR